MGFDRGDNGDRGFSSPGPGTSSFDVASEQDFERALDDRLAIEREQDRPGRLGVTSEFVERGPLSAYGPPSFGSRAWSAAKPFVTSILSMAFPPAATAITFAEISAMKAMGYSDEEINNAALSGIMNAALTANPIGALVVGGAKWAGGKLREAGFNEPASGPAISTGEISGRDLTTDPTTNFDRSILGRARDAAMARRRNQYGSF